MTLLKVIGFLMCFFFSDLANWQMLGGGFKDFLFSSVFGEDSHFD